MAEFDVDLFVIGGGSGGVRAARIAAGHGARVMIAEEYRDGRHLRDPRLRAEEAVRARLACPARDRGRRRLRLDHPARTFDWPTLIANKDKEIARLEAVYTTNVEKSRARSIVKTRAVFEDPHTLRLADRRDGARKAHPDRDRRRAQPRHGDSRHRARDLLERGVSS